MKNLHQKDIGNVPTPFPVAVPIPTTIPLSVSVSPTVHMSHPVPLTGVSVKANMISKLRSAVAVCKEDNQNDNNQNDNNQNDNNQNNNNQYDNNQYDNQDINCRNNNFQNNGQYNDNQNDNLANPAYTVCPVDPVKSSPWEDSVITDMRPHTRHALTQALKEHTHKKHLSVDRESASVAHRVDLELNSMLRLTTFEPSLVVLDILYNALPLKDKYTLAVVHAAVHQSNVWGEEMKRNVRLSVRLTIKKKKNPEKGYFGVAFNAQDRDEDECCKGMLVQLPKVRTFIDFYFYGYVLFLSYYQLLSNKMRNHRY